MKKSNNIILTVLIALLVLTLSSCKSSKENKPSLNSDGTIGDVTWGMPVSEASDVLKNAFGDNYSETEHVSRSILSVENVSFYNEKVALQYMFSDYHDYQDDAGKSLRRLDTIRVCYPEDYDKEAATNYITDIFGERQTKFSSFSGTVDAPMPEDQQFWHSDKSLADLPDGGLKQELIHLCVMDDYGLDSEEERQAYIKWYMSQKYLCFASFYTDETSNLTTLDIDGSCHLLYDGYLLG